MCNLALAMALFMFVSAGLTLAGEENLMAMRGSPPDGAIAVNKIKSLQNDDHYTAPQAVGREKGGIADKAPGYLGWKDTCVPQRIQLADRTLEWRGKTCFGMAPRFVFRDEESNPGAFLGEFLREFTK